MKNLIRQILRESQKDTDLLKDGTTIVFPFDYEDKDVYKILDWLESNGWTFGYTIQGLKKILDDCRRRNSQASQEKFKVRPFLMLRIKNQKKTIYWSPTRDLSSNPNTFKDKIDAEDVLKIIDTNFFIDEGSILGENEFDWFQPEINLEGIEPGSLFLINRIDPDTGLHNIDYDLLVRFNDVVDIHTTEEGNIDAKITMSTFNDRKNKKWILNDGKIELSWARNLIDTGYYIPITKKEADELFKDFSRYKP